MALEALEELRLQLNPAAGPEKQPLRCFIVDDEPDIRRFMSFTLRKSGIDADDYSTIDEMLGGLARKQPDVIFLDVWLDGADAIDAIRLLGERGFAGHVQLMSGRDAAVIEQVKHIGELRNLRMLPVIQKPFRPGDLRNLIHRLSANPDQTVAWGPGGAKGGPHAKPGPQIELSEALRAGWLELWYQPKLNIQKNRFEGAEGLIRARHPVHGVLQPSSFLPGAHEDTVIALTDFVITTALRDWRLLAQSGHSMRLAVNAPVSALSKLPIPALIKEHAPKTPRWPGLIIEVTEDEIIRDIPLANEIATQLRLYNVSLAIDDFGAGYSSFARLRALPFCELKLDQSFVANCATDRTNESICQTIIDLAHRFGTVAVAEGIEKGPDLLALYQMGCDIGQGLYLAPPLPRQQLALSIPAPRKQVA
jgi:EAL domain-containing protein (putative c-di-GMP-specific phosphodiesterase class I)/CheY-like chemotaxis protein